MYCIVVVGAEEFMDAASTELISKGMAKILDGVFVVNSINNFDTISKGLKSLEAYKKQQSKNSIYKTTSLIKI